MKKIVFLNSIAVLLLIYLTGCNNIVEIEDNQIYDAIVDAYPYKDNLKILTKERFKNKVLIIISYDEANGHFVEYLFADVKKGQITISGGSGGIAETDLENPRPLTFSSSWAYNNDDESFFITYGEIFDEQVKLIRIEYSDGIIISKQIHDTGYAIIREEKVNGVKTIEALDDNKNIIYRIP